MSQSSKSIADYLRNDRLRSLRRARETFTSFAHQEAAGAIVMLVAAVVALVVANSSLWEAYEAFWHTEVGVFVGSAEFAQSILHWVDDALMALFFLVVGLEIKREFLVGELSDLRGATLPVVAALGGMIVPALIYVALNAGGPGVAGWGVPMATDIAFALGVMAVLGSRAPAGLKVFLTALAIVDDIGAILVIAVFYTSGLATEWLLFALVPLAVLVAMNRMQVSEPLFYLAVGSILWFAVLNSGVHATIAGVIVALTLPAESTLSTVRFTLFAREKVDQIEALEDPEAHTIADDEQQLLGLELADAAHLTASPLQRLEFMLHPFTTMVVLPLFALGNAGVRFVDYEGSKLLSPVALGVILGLVIGKPLGIYFASRLAVGLGFASLPAGVTWRHILGAGVLGGIGFTMSIFVANLAFSDPVLTAEAKVAILVASAIAGTAGFLVLRATAEQQTAA